MTLDSKYNKYLDGEDQQGESEKMEKYNKEKEKEKDRERKAKQKESMSEEEKALLKERNRLIKQLSKTRMSKQKCYGVKVKDRNRRKKSFTKQ